jgi:hypothetical protein
MLTYLEYYSLLKEEKDTTSKITKFSQILGTLNVLKYLVQIQSSMKEYNILATPLLLHGCEI